VSALDVSVQAQITNLLMVLQDALGLTYLIITYDLSLVGHMADAVGVMYLGRFVERGPGVEVCQTPRHPYSEPAVGAVGTWAPNSVLGRWTAGCKVPGNSIEPSMPNRIRSADAADG